MGHIVSVLLPDGVIGVDEHAVIRPGDEAAKVAHHKFAVGVHDVKVEPGRLPVGQRPGERDIAILEHEQRRGGDVVDGVLLVAFPAAALGREHMHLMSAAGQLAVEREDGRRHAVDLGIERIGKQADLHAELLLLWNPACRNCLPEGGAQENPAAFGIHSVTHPADLEKQKVFILHFWADSQSVMRFRLQIPRNYDRICMKKQGRMHLPFLKARGFLGGFQRSHVCGVNSDADRRKLDGFPLPVPLR